MKQATAPLLISACLLGIACRYDSASRDIPDVRDFLHRHHLLPVPICPEQLGGLPTPRTPCQFCGGDGKDLWQGTATLVNEDGHDLTPFFQRGAREALKIAQLCGCKAALLKERSPSCGVRAVHCEGMLRAGTGVTTVLLREAGLYTFNDEELAEVKLFLAEHQEFHLAVPEKT
ncbi:MAG: DUF523 domain-containing protein, partial [Deltaproteobacteria bacterium]|nr:DUF523 domain-containing protein [Deltaproteobacteria bacterium]